VRALINTHHHGDHTHGNYLFRPAAVIGHRQCREQVLAFGHPSWEGVFSPNDVVAWIPERRVLFAGDLAFNRGTPFVVMGSEAAREDRSGGVGEADLGHLEAVGAGHPDDRLDHPPFDDGLPDGPGHRRRRQLEVLDGKAGHHR
jgi:cyclase